jgi:hypothetical protein
MTYAVLAMFPLPLLTIAFPNVDAGLLHWHMTWMNPDKYASRVQLAATVRALPRPMLVKDEILSLPWNSTADSYPAISSDWFWYELARTRGRLHGSVESKIASKGFETLVLPLDDPLFPQAMAAGYTVRELIDSALSPNGMPKAIAVLSR